MPSPVIDSGASVPISQLWEEFLPDQGSFEVQHDQPGKTHGWHRHSIHETLVVVKGSVSFFWDESGTTRETMCGPGARIFLPANTLHGSTAGEEGCVYVIASEGGRTAETTFL